MRVVIALDQGTTSSRAIIFDLAGSIVTVAQQEFEQHYPRPGWVEHDPMDIWNTQVAVVEKALAAAGVSNSEIVAVGIANQRETTLVWDRQTGEPIHPAIVWQDRRTAPHCQALKNAGHEATIRAKTGLVLDPYFSATKLSWILEHVEGARSRAEAGELAFGTVDTWLAWQLTAGGLHITDASNASRTMLCNIHDGGWDEDLLDIFDVPRALLPDITTSSQIFAEIKAIPALAGVPLAGIAGDQQAATFGQACVTPGMAKCTYGTGCFLLLNTGQHAQISDHQLLTTIAWEQDEQVTYALEGSVFVGGAIVQWLRDGLGIIKASAEVEPLARSVSDNGGVYLVPALAGLGAPHWDPHARGTILGLTSGSTAAHIARAALEGIAFQVADLVEAMGADTPTGMTELRVDGGAAVNDLLMQFQADLLQIPVVRPTTLETTALGAAYLAGLATGDWSSAQELSRHWQVGQIFEPQVRAGDAGCWRERWHEAVKRSQGWVRE